MDLGGLLLLRDGSMVWFVLFTCMPVRAVYLEHAEHLELVSAILEKALVLALQWFVSRRGPGEVLRGSVL